MPFWRITVVPPSVCLRAAHVYWRFVDTLATSMSSSSSPTTIAVAILYGRGRNLLHRQRACLGDIGDRRNTYLGPERSKWDDVGPSANARSASDATGVIGWTTILAPKINHAPVGIRHRFRRRTLYTMRSVDFGFTDPMDTPSIHFAVKIVTLQVGTLADNGTTAGQFISARRHQWTLVFTPISLVAGHASFAVQVEDRGTAGGGQNLDPSRKFLISASPTSTTHPWNQAVTVSEHGVRVQDLGLWIHGLMICFPTRSP